MASFVKPNISKFTELEVKTNRARQQEFGVFPIHLKTSEKQIYFRPDQTKRPVGGESHSQKSGIDYNDTFSPVEEKVIFRISLYFFLDSR
jgi:hypothetical protein